MCPGGGARRTGDFYDSAQVHSRMLLHFEARSNLTMNVRISLCLPLSSPRTLPTHSALPPSHPPLSRAVPFPALAAQSSSSTFSLSRPDRPSKRQCGASRMSLSSSSRECNEGRAMGAVRSARGGRSPRPRWELAQAPTGPRQAAARIRTQGPCMRAVS